MTVSDIKLTRAGPGDVAAGLLGWITCSIGRLRLDGIALRRTRRGRWTLSFPARHSLSGQQFPYIRPLDDRARRQIEAQVFRALGLEEGVP